MREELQTWQDFMSKLVALSAIDPGHKNWILASQKRQWS